ncbi:MAG: hypothetical protein WD847_08275 [Pirellulales bacterium]
MDELKAIQEWLRLFMRLPGLPEGEQGHAINKFVWASEDLAVLAVRYGLDEQPLLELRSAMNAMQRGQAPKGGALGSALGSACMTVRRIEVRAKAAQIASPATATDLVDLKEVERQTGIAKGTMENRQGRPAPKVPHRGNAPALYSWAELRPWLLETFPSRAFQIPAKLSTCGSEGT